jgi:hypothetical protein
VIRHWLLAFLPAWSTMGCALASKGTPVEVHWYTPELVHPGSANRPPAGPALRLGHVQSSTDLEERIAWGDGAYQMGFYEDRRWTKRPAPFVTKALRRALFETHGLQPAIEAGAAPRLEVQLVSFQEIRSRRAHAGRVALHVQLLADRVLLDTTIVRDEPVVGEQFDDVVAAIARALDAAANEVAERVEACLCMSPGADGRERFSCRLPPSVPLRP